MKTKCEIVKDLLPLYKDGICSEESSQMIKEHLNECQSCSSLYQNLGNTAYENILQKERDTILKRHAEKERKRAVTIGTSIAAILMIPIIVCLICNLAIGHSLDWFFIVAASLLVLASITVVPFIVPEKKGLYTILSFTASLLLLFLVCCIYTGGGWFFVASISTLLGLSVLFLPYVLYNLPLPEVLQNHKGLLSMVIDTILLFGVILVCGLYSQVALYWQTALPITAFGIILPWALFVIIRYFRINGWSKAGLCFIVSGFYCGFINDFLSKILDKTDCTSIRLMDFRNWTTPQVISANVDFIILLSCIVTGIILLAVGFIRNHKLA